MIGGIHVHLKGTAIADRVAEIWRIAGLRTDRLLKRNGRVLHSNPEPECPAGVILTISSDTALRQEFVPESRTMPPHVRVRMGPLVWIVTDRAAYVRTLQLWDHAVLCLESHEDGIIS
jgi:hypothetical protein